VTVTNLSNGCTSSDVVNAIETFPPTITYDVRENPCPEFSRGHIIPFVTGGKAPYTYNWSNGSTNQFLNSIKEGVFTVTITDANGCTQTDNFTLVQGFFEIATNKEVNIELGEEALLTSQLSGNSGQEQLQWSPENYLNCTDCPNTISAAMGSIKYTVSAIDTNGCTAKDTVKVNVTPKYDYYVPNSFSPNADGVNDVYEIFGNKKIWSFMEFTIFNRWGEKVFQTNDHYFTWDGSFMGELMTPGVFVYELKITYVNGRVENPQKGSITLIR
jgi:gliding motility-associated-like protein